MPGFQHTEETQRELNILLADIENLEEKVRKETVTKAEAQEIRRALLNRRNEALMTGGERYSTGARLDRIARSIRRM